MEVDFLLIEHHDQLIQQLELHLVRQAKHHDPDAFHRLRSVPGIGKILAMTILYEIQDIARFPRVQDFLSYSRLVKCEHSSAGKKLGSGGSKIGNAHLWASPPYNWRHVLQTQGNRTEPDGEAQEHRSGVTRSRDGFMDTGPTLLRLIGGPLSLPTHSRDADRIGSRGSLPLSRARWQLVV